MEGKPPTLLSDEDKIFYLLFQYHHHSFNKTIWSNNAIYKIKQKIKEYFQNSQKSQRKKFAQSANKDIIIVTKENKKAIETEQPKEEPKPSQEEKPKEELIQPKKQKTFIVLGGIYNDIIEALKKEGWLELENKEDESFDYLFTLNKSDIKFESLKSGQMVNHFKEAREITVKSVLLKNLKNLFLHGIDMNFFYPRAYSLSEQNDLEDFIEEFKTNKAISILKHCLASKGLNCNKDMVQVALNILKKKKDFLNKAYDIKSVIDKVKWKNNDKKKEEVSTIKIPLISDEEWGIIGEENMKKYQEIIDRISREKIIGLNKDQKPLKKEPKAAPEKKAVVEEKIDQAEIEEIKKEIKKISSAKESTDKEEEDDDEDEEKEKEQKPDTHGIYQRNWETTAEPKEKKDDVSSMLPEIEEVLSSYKSQLPEYTLDGENNIWIVKPGGLSRGRGIFCSNELNEILSSIKLKGKTIIQKYIENPLIINKRKFDIRQWVLVTNLEPLTVWLFDTPYLRFGAEDYSATDFKNVFSQLTNNSIAKYSENFGKNEEIKEDMWNIETFQAFLEKTYGKNYWPEIQEKIKKIVLYSLFSAKQKIFNRKNTHEVFGYDLMIDEHLNVYLIEINASPAWDYSTKVTEKLVKIMSHDLVQVVVRYAETPVKERSKVDTGRLKRIYCSSAFPSFEEKNVNEKNLV